MEVTVKDGQTLADIAIQEYGSTEAVPILAEANDKSASDMLVPGEKLTLPDFTPNKIMERYCKNNDVSPATDRDLSGNGSRVFTDVFAQEFS